MPRTLRWIALACVLLSMPLTGCETKEVWLEMPAFADGTVDGIWLWREAEGAHEYVRACRIEFGDVEPGTMGTELLPYIQGCGDGHAGVLLHADVERSQGDPSTVTVRLWYMRWEKPGVYRVSSYGEDGESALSDTTLPL